MNERFETFTVLITKIARNIKKIKNQEMAGYDLRSPHISCLYYLYIADGLIAADLCERCEEDKATISRALDYLEENGYTVCESGLTKRYKIPIHLTEKGMDAGKRIHDKVNQIMDDVSTGLTEEERIAFYRTLAVISDRLEQYAAPADVRAADRQST